MVSAKAQPNGIRRKKRQGRCCSLQNLIICQCFLAGAWSVFFFQRYTFYVTFAPPTEGFVAPPHDTKSMEDSAHLYQPPPKAESSYWKRSESKFDMKISRSRKPAIEAFGLSVNHLQLIPLAGGALPEQVSAPEDFLPVVLNNNIQLRFRLQAIPGSQAYASQDIKAYQISAVEAHSKATLWDTGKVSVSSMPDHVPWGGPMIPVGTIVEWKVSVWDYANVGPAVSEPTKFAVGPSDQDFHGKWIVHPKDKSLFTETEIQEFWRGNKQPGVDRWKARRPLPLARAKIDLTQTEASDIVSAMLVVSGLGAFSASVDGKPLSSSSAMDPPLTEFSLRISYRGYDVTPFFAGSKNKGSHVIGVTLGSGWFDARPLDGGIIKHHLLPRGPLTTVAQLHVTLKNGETKVLAPTGSGDWQMAKGHLLDSDIFTGDVTDLGRKKALMNWDTPAGWMATGSKVGSTDIVWEAATAYTSNIDTQKWREIITGRAVDTAPNVNPMFDTAPLGKLVPIEAPPVMPIERFPVESIQSLGDGRWLLDFGKAISGVVRFDEGLPKSIKPSGEYPRAHKYETNDDFISVVYGENIQMETGDINLVLVAGMGLHDGGARKTRGNPIERAGPGYPKDHGTILAQRDVFVVPKSDPDGFKSARQSSFTTHGFRFAEVCCTEAPPTGAHAVLYRTAFEEWGKFDSSHVNLNGAYELIRNAFNSNMLGVQSDCPHREKLQYGGDLMADSPAAMHLYDLGAFYNKVIHDWTDVQWSNGAYTETTPWHDLNDYAGIGHGAGETVWASLPVVLTVRHMQHYGEMKLLRDTLDHHVEWMNFMKDNWDSINWDNFGGLGDWLTVHSRDTYLTHHAYLMATTRSIAYIANQLIGQRGDAQDILKEALGLTTLVREWLNKKYTVESLLGNAFTMNMHSSTPSADLGLFTRIVNGKDRCSVLHNFIHHIGSGIPRKWHGGEETKLYNSVSDSTRQDMLKRGLGMQLEKAKQIPTYKLGYNTFEGILAIRYTLKTLSDMGFHHIAVNKVAGKGFPSVEYMMSHNATTMWETWWRSEDVFSRNHPMLGAIAEWLPSSVAGVALSPRTAGGRELLFWPRIPTNSKLSYASATQGTKRGDAAIAWRFEEDLDESKVPSSVTVQIRILVPPGSSGIFRVPTEGTEAGQKAQIQYASTMPNFQEAKTAAYKECQKRRREGKGFDYNFEYDRSSKQWSIRNVGKAIGTPCESFLFDASVNRGATWASSDEIIIENPGRDYGIEVELSAGLYQVKIDNWKMEKFVELNELFTVKNPGALCRDTEAFDWDLFDASYLI